MLCMSLIPTNISLRYYFAANLSFSIHVTTCTKYLGTWFGTSCHKCPSYQVFHHFLFRGTICYLCWCALFNHMREMIHLLFNFYTVTYPQVLSFINIPCSMLIRDFYFYHFGLLPCKYKLRFFHSVLFYTPVCQFLCLFSYYTRPMHPYYITHTILIPIVPLCPETNILSSHYLIMYWLPLFVWNIHPLL